MMKVRLIITTIIWVFILFGVWLTKTVYGDMQPSPTLDLTQPRADYNEALNPNQPDSWLFTIWSQLNFWWPAAKNEDVLQQSLAAWHHVAIAPQPLMGAQKLLFSPNGKWLASSQADNTVQLWDYEVMAQPQLSPKMSLPHRGKVTTLAFSPNNQSLATTGDDGWVYIWSFNSRPLFTQQQLYPAVINSLAFSPDSQWLVMGSPNQAVYLWPLTHEAAAIYHVLKLKLPPLNMAQFSPDGRWLATVNGPQVELWEMATTRRIWQMCCNEKFKGENITNITFSPNKKWLATADWTGRVHLWDIPFISTHRNDIICPLPFYIQHQPGAWTRMAFSHNGNFLAVSGGNSVSVWELSDNFAGLTTTMPLMDGIRHQDSVSQIAFDSQHDWLISTSVDNTTKVWNIPDKQEVSHIPPNTPLLSLALHPHELVLATTSGQMIELWQSNQGGKAVSIK